MAIDSMAERVKFGCDTYHAENGEVGQEQRSFPAARLVYGNYTHNEGGGSKGHLRQDIADWRVGFRTAVEVETRLPLWSFPAMYSILKKTLTHENGGRYQESGEMEVSGSDQGSDVVGAVLP
jgi:hypothetical protein